MHIYSKCQRSSVVLTNWCLVESSCYVVNNKNKIALFFFHSIWLRWRNVLHLYIMVYVFQTGVQLQAVGYVSILCCFCCHKSPRCLHRVPFCRVPFSLKRVTIMTYCDIVLHSVAIIQQFPQSVSPFTCLVANEFLWEMCKSTFYTRDVTSRQCRPVTCDDGDTLQTVFHSIQGESGVREWGELPPQDNLMNAALLLGFMAPGLHGLNANWLSLPLFSSALWPLTSVGLQTLCLWRYWVRLTVLFHICLFLLHWRVGRSWPLL